MLLLLCVFAELSSLAGYLLTTGQWLSFADAQSQRERVQAGEPGPLVEAEDAGPAPGPQVLHPYLGFVFEHTAGKRAINKYGFMGPAPPFEIGGPAVPRSRDPNRAVVAVVGGSVAQQMVQQTAGLLGRELATSNCFAGRTIEVVNLALPGVKQPQQLMTLNYFSSIGAVVDVWISLDGFNEVALPQLENQAVGVFPFYPRNWSFQVAGISNISVMRRVGEIEFWQSLRSGVASTFSRLPMRFSATANLLWVLLDRVLRKNVSMKKVDLTLSQSDGSENLGGYVRRGPTRDYASEKLQFADYVSVWERSIHLMHGASRAAGMASFHFLQPNQRVPGSKVFAPGEREIALAGPQAYDAPTRKGYPGLIEAGKRMRAAGLPFDDLTMVFADVEEAIYIDSCCHVNTEGSRRMVLEIARLIRARFDAGEACPRFQ